MLSITNKSVIDNGTIWHKPVGRNKFSNRVLIIYFFAVAPSYSAMLCKIVFEFTCKFKRRILQSVIYSIIIIILYSVKKWIRCIYSVADVAASDTTKYVLNLKLSFLSFSIFAPSWQWEYIWSFLHDWSWQPTKAYMYYENVPVI